MMSPPRAPSTWRLSPPVRIAAPSRPGPWPPPAAPPSRVTSPRPCAMSCGIGTPRCFSPSWRCPWPRPWRRWRTPASPSRMRCSRPARWSSMLASPTPPRPPGPPLATSSTCPAPNSFRRFCSTSSTCLGLDGPRPATPPTRAPWPTCTSRPGIRSWRICSSIATPSSCARPSRVCAKRSCPTGASTPPSSRRSPPPAGSPRPTPTCRTFRRGPRRAGASVRPSPSARATSAC